MGLWVESGECMISVDIKAMQKALKAIEMNPAHLLNIEGAGAKVLVNGMRMRVPVDTAATKNSVNSHITEATATRVVDEVGPETDYAPDIEYGIKSKPNYPVQPFVRPTAFEEYGKVVNVIGTSFGQLVISLWPK